MKTFTKILALLIALMMVVSVFAACAGKKDDKNDNKNDGTTDDGGTTTPPDDGGTTTPPDDGGTTNPPDEGGNEVEPPVDTDTAQVYNPSFGALNAMPLEYAWGNGEMTLDFTDSKIVRVKVSELDAEIAALLEEATVDKFTERVLALKGEDTFALPGFTAAQQAKLFTVGYTYTISIEYYAKAAGSMSVVTVNEAGERVLFAAEDCEEGVNSLSVDFTVAEGDTGIAFKTTGADAEIYLGRLTLELYTYGPTYNQLAAGYTFDWASIPEGVLSGTRVQVKDITDEAAKAAILAAGKTEDDYIWSNMADPVLAMSASHYVHGRKYTVDITYYTNEDGGGYNGFLVMDETPGNHGIKGSMFTTKGAVATASCLWKVDDGDYSATFYESPKNMYVLAIKITLDTSYDPHYSRTDIHETTASELEAPYTFDFSEGNAPTDAELFVKVAELPAQVKELCTAENGFGDSVIHIAQESFSFKSSINGTFKTDTKYKFTARVYSANGNVGGLLLLPMGTNKQEGNDSGSPTVTPVEGAPAGIYDVSWEILANEVVVTAQFYSSPAEEIYIGSITVAPGEYVAPEPLPEPGTTKYEAEDIAAAVEGKNNPYASAGYGSPITVVDTPDAVKEAMGDKVADKAVKISTTSGAFLANESFVKLDPRNGKVGYKLTIELYVESLNSPDVKFIFNGNTNDFVDYSGLTEGANTIVLDYVGTASTWNIGMHQGDFVGYVGDISIELYHVVA